MVDMRRTDNRLTRLAAIALAACACAWALVAAPAPASAATVINGISDQNLGQWAGDYQDASANFTVPFDDFFAQTWVGSQASPHLTYARFVTAPDAVAQGGLCQQNLANWFAYVTQTLHLKPVIAVWDVAEGGCADHGRPSPAAYATDITQLLDYLDGLGDGAVSYVEAWDEPNASGVSPVQAAGYWTAANTACQSAVPACIAIAGDFVDNDPDQGGQAFDPGCSPGLTWANRLVPYETAYVAALGGALPAVWGFHPYFAVNCEQSASVTAFEANLADPGAQVWFTEVAAWECVRGSSTPRGVTQQAADAQYLVNTLIPATSPSAVFYYEMAPLNYTLSCSKYSDSELFEAPSSPGPLLARPAAQVIYGADSTLAAVTAAVHAVTSTQATFTGTLVPGGIYEASYHFDYGPTSAYGLQTPEQLVGPGLTQQPASATVSGLAPNTAYHYQLVVTDANGEVIPGGDETMAPVLIETNTATVTTGTSITVSWSGISDPTNTDWVGLYQSGAPDSADTADFYADSCTQASDGAALPAGSCTVTMPQAPGSYEFRLYSAPAAGLLNASGTVTSVPPPPVDNVAPLIGGGSSAARAYAGQTLSCSTGAWSNAPTAYAYQWSSDGSPLQGATGQIYVVLPDELGDSLSCSVVASNAGGSGPPAGSAAVAILRPPPASSAPPSISGHALVGDRLIESRGRWSNAPVSFADQWQRCDSRGGNCRAIAGAIRSAYTLRAADAGFTLRVVEVASDASGPGAPASSRATGVVAWPPPRTLLLGEAVDAGRHSATFSFKASGSSRGFECALVREPARSVRFSPCRSPKTYRALARGSYLFETRAIGLGGVRARPLTYRFAIP